MCTGLRRQMRPDLRSGKVLIDPSSAKLMANDVMAHVRQMGTVKMGVDGRLTIK